MNTRKGKLFIEMDHNNQPLVIFEPIEGEIWMNRNELCELFGVYQNAIDKSLDNIFKATRLQIDDLCRYHRYVKSGKICFDITEVNLDLIVTLAFQLDTPQANLLRKWFVEQCLKAKQLDCALVSTEQNYSWN